MFTMFHPTLILIDPEKILHPQSEPSISCRSAICWGLFSLSISL